MSVVNAQKAWSCWNIHRHDADTIPPLAFSILQPVVRGGGGGADDSSSLANDGLVKEGSICGTAGMISVVFAGVPVIVVIVVIIVREASASGLLSAGTGIIGSSVAEALAGLQGVTFSMGSIL
jgi:hypothetical protein